MKRTNAFCIILLTFTTFVSVSVFAADKVVVVPLSSGARAAMPVAFGQVNGTQSH